MKLKLKKEINMLLLTVLFVILFNLIIPLIILPYVKKEDLNKNNNELSLGSRIVKMMVFHVENPILTSIILLILVLPSIFLAKLF
tara:strand:- start:255 stop:509 length:255 start_codon:yes stop_codon:yes gene_type:complete